MKYKWHEDIAPLPGDAPDPRSKLAYFGYFSFVTLSTLGYGDITPLTRPARAPLRVTARFARAGLGGLPRQSFFGSVIWRKCSPA